MDYLSKDKAAIEQVLQQAPPDVGYNEAKLAYHAAKRDVSQALANLWNLPPLPERRRPTGVNAEKWEEVRNLCDEFDAAAARALRAATARPSNPLQSPIIQEANDLKPGA